MPHFQVDPEAEVAAEQFAVVATSKRQRKRFPEGCVEVYGSEGQARAAADPRQNRYSARVYGPSRSSEGLRLYYLVAWLE